MKLFLTSSCISKNLRETFLEHFGKDPRSSKCYFIPTASDPDESKFYTCKSMDDLVELGFNPIWYSLKYKTKELIRQELSDADIIWVGGGNTFYLLDVARCVGFLDVVTDLVKNKGVAYGGVSAGTILASPNIASAGWEPHGDPNDIRLTDLIALGLVNFTSVVHYTEDQKETVNKNRVHDKLVYTILDGGMVIVDGEELKLVGGTKEYVS